MSYLIIMKLVLLLISSLSCSFLYIGLYIVDSMPLDVYKFSRANRSKVCQEHEESAPDFGFCAAQNFHYFGYKLHAVYNPDGIIKMYDISKASNRDIHFSNDIQSQLDNCVLVGDKDCLNQQ